MTMMHAPTLAPFVHGAGMANTTAVATSARMRTADAATLMAKSMGQLQGTTAKQVAHALSTQAQGVPEQFDDAWHWAADWVKTHGVTLPPDTSALRSLRNFFCYQVSMFKKGKLSRKSAERFAHYGIDLASYHAPSAVRSVRRDYGQLFTLLCTHYEKHGSYDLTHQSDAQLIAWQKRLLRTYFTLGVSARMREFAATLPGFSFGAWLRPGEASIPSSEYSWWSQALAFRTAAKTKPAFRGKLDPSMHASLREWASNQIEAVRQGGLSPRQRGELRTLNIITRTSTKHSQRKSAVLATMREEAGTGGGRANSKRDRDVTTFRGASLLAGLLYKDAPKGTIYRNLCVNPAQYARMLGAIEAILPDIQKLAHHTNLNFVRTIHSQDPDECDALARLGKLPINAYADFTVAQTGRLERLMQVIVEIGDAMRRINVRQDLQALQGNALNS